jgi:biopolymer transport protein ExbD
MRNGVAIFIVLIIVAFVIIILNPNFASNKETKLNEEIKNNEKNVKAASINFIETYYVNELNSRYKSAFMTEYVSKYPDNDYFCITFDALKKYKSITDVKYNNVSCDGFVYLKKDDVYNHIVYFYCDGEYVSENYNMVNELDCF